MTMNNEYRGVWKKSVIICFKVQIQHSPGETEESQEKPTSGQPVTRSGFDPCPSCTEYYRCSIILFSDADSDPLLITDMGFVQNGLALPN
jgi:hypothetical protein